jgi:hypothetical protein
LLRLSLKNLKGCNVGITDEGIREFRRWDGSFAMLYLVSS